MIKKEAHKLNIGKVFSKLLILLEAKEYPKQKPKERGYNRQKELINKSQL